MVEKLFPDKEVPWAATEKGITMNDFTAKAWIWLNITSSWISPSTHMTAVIGKLSYMVSCILDNNPLTVYHLVLSDIKFYRNYGGTHLLFPSLINELCKKVRVVEYPDDTWVSPGTPIYHLKIQGEGAPGKRKKRKIDLGKSTVEESESYRPSTFKPLEDIGIDIRFINELVSGLPQGLGDPSTRQHSYVSCSDYDKYPKKQQTYEATISRLKKA
ncbi:hypothetical protein FXO38_13905 [Capsicum annuum]|nr:hypothetical protein FXO38_13905 [Capsicum annuum]